MALFNSLRIPVMAGVRSAVSSIAKPMSKPVCNIQVIVREMGTERKMQLTPSRFTWERMKDDWHYFLVLGLVPIGVIITCVNTFVGPAELQEIPEGYIPKTHEYIKCPIQRMWCEHYFYPSYEKQYERSLYFVNKAHENKLTVLKVRKANELMRQRQDYKNWYYVPVSLDDRAAANEARKKNKEDRSIKL